MTNTVYCVQTWYLLHPDDIDTSKPYATLGAARGRLTRLLRHHNYSGQAPYYAGRVLELTGEWVEVD